MKNEIEWIEQIICRVLPQAPAVFICMLLLEMMPLRLKGSFLALIELAILAILSLLALSIPLLTVWPQSPFITNPTVVTSPSLALGEGKEGKWWFGCCLWFPLLLPFPAPHPPVS